VFGACVICLSCVPCVCVCVCCVNTCIECVCVLLCHVFVLIVCGLFAGLVCLCYMSVCDVGVVCV